MWDDYNAFDDSVSLEDAVSSGNWGGSADTDFYSGTDGISNAWDTGNWNFGSNTGDVSDALSQYYDWSGNFNSFNDQDLSSAVASGNWGQSADSELANFGNSNSGVTQTLSNIFNTIGSNKNAQGLLGKGLSALLSGYQSNKASDAYKKLAQSSTIDPFGAQRPFYQQQLQQAVSNPNSIPMIQQQTQALAKAQAIKDAAAGRRSNNATSSPGLLLAQSQAAQDYMKSLMTPAGANISPNAGAYTDAMGKSITQGTNSYISPLMYLLGNSNTPTTTSARNSGTNMQGTSALNDLFGLLS